MGQNPPPGAIIYYSLGKKPKNPVTISIIDSAGNIAHTFSTEPEATNSVENSDTIDLGAKYSRSSGLSTNTGLNRLVWYEIIEADRERRDLVVECLNAIPGVECPLLGATIYAFPDISYYGIASNELSADILDKTHVAVESECSA